MKLEMLIVILLFVFSGCALAEIYQWRDAQGRLHFGDRPRTEDASVVELKNTIGGKSPAPVDKEGLEQRKRLLNAFDKKRQKEKAATDKAARDLDALREKCDRARRSLEFYQQTNRIFQEEDDGKRRYYTDEQRDALIAGLENDIKQYCH